MNIQSAIFKTMLGAISMLALGASAHAQNQEIMRNNNATNNWSRVSYVDLATTTISGHDDNHSWTFGGVAGLRYKLLQLDRGGLSSGAQCFEVATGAPTYLPDTVSDTRLWIVSHLGDWTTPPPRGLNDDIDGTLFSAARVYLKGAPGSYVNLAVAAYSPVWNSMHFNLVVNQLPLSESSCATGQSKPWVKVINGNMTVSANAS